MELATGLHVEIRATATKAAHLQEGSAKPGGPLLAQFIHALTDGTGLDKANQVYSLEGAVGAGAFADIDLVATVKDIFGDTITATSVKAFFVHNTSTTAAVLYVGGGTDGAGTAAFDTWIRSAAVGGAGDGSEQVILPKNACQLIWNPTAAGYGIAGGSDNLSIEGDAALAGTFNLMVICEV